MRVVLTPATRANEGETISLDGSGSSDPGGSIAAYAWDLDGDNQYDDATGISPNFTLPAAGSLTTIGLRVTDNEGATDTDKRGRNDQPGWLRVV
jgi:hypothetical protein